MGTIKEAAPAARTKAEAEQVQTQINLGVRSRQSVLRKGRLNSD